MTAIAIDSNLLVLLVVGLTDRNLICKHKRTKAFTEVDFEQLTQLLEPFEEIVVTPHVLTEASNLIAQIGDPAMTQLRTTFSILLESYTENYSAARNLRGDDAFIRLGLTDCAILDLVKSDMALLTVDLALYLKASETNSRALNFNHLRQSRLIGI